jgi:hypothetical protein
MASRSLGWRSGSATAVRPRQKRNEETRRRKQIFMIEAVRRKEEQAGEGIDGEGTVFDGAEQKLQIVDYVA